MKKTLSIMALAPFCAACAGQFGHLGKAPELSTVGQPAQQEEVRVVSMPMPHAASETREPNALWVSGRRSFFRDQRAQSVGDILTVVIDIDEGARIRNSSARDRQNAEGLSLNNAFGLEQSLGQLLPSEYDPENAVDLGSTSRSAGSGTIDRNEDISVRVAAVITQTLPNGNFVIAGRQEVRVNFELRELRVAGVIRPEDITPGNTIDYTKVAEARIAYGGRGQLTDVTQPRIGQQVYDIIMPF